MVESNSEKSINKHEIIDKTEHYPNRENSNDKEIKRIITFSSELAQFMKQKEISSNDSFNPNNEFDENSHVNERMRNYTYGLSDDEGDRYLVNNEEMKVCHLLETLCHPLVRQTKTNLRFTYQYFDLETQGTNDFCEDHHAG